MGSEGYLYRPIVHCYQHNIGTKQNSTVHFFTFPLYFFETSKSSLKSI